MEKVLAQSTDIHWEIEIHFRIGKFISCFDNILKLDIVGSKDVNIFGFFCGKGVLFLLQLLRPETNRSIGLKG